jgi:hypothetical protein
MKGSIKMKMPYAMALLLITALLTSCISIETFQSHVTSEDPPLDEWHASMNDLLRDRGFERSSFGARTLEGKYQVEMGFSLSDLTIDVGSLRDLIMALQREMIRSGNKIPEIQERCDGEVKPVNCKLWVYLDGVIEDLPGRDLVDTAVLNSRSLICWRSTGTEPFLVQVALQTREELEAHGPYPSLDEAWERVLACSAELKPIWEAQCAQAEKKEGNES